MKSKKSQKYSMLPFPRLRKSRQVMGRKRSFMNRQTQRALSKLDPSGCLTFVLLGLALLIMGIIFICNDMGSIVLPIIEMLVGVVFIIVGIILGVKHYHKKDNSSDDSDYTQF